MQYRNIGKHALKVSSIGLGCMGMSHAYGEAVDKYQMHELLSKAVDLGYTFFDTAEVYGTTENPHHNEEMLGSALKAYRNKVVIATKFGLRFDLKSGCLPYPLLRDSCPETIRKSVEGSLRRLQTDHIDLYYQHRTDPKIPMEEVAETVKTLIKEGKVLQWGLSEVGEDEIRCAHAICPVTAIQNRYSMMARWYEKLFPVLEELKIGFVAFSPLANGLLSDRYTANTHFESATDYRSTMIQFKAESYEKNQQLFELIRSLAVEKQATPAQISLAWLLCKKPWIVPIPGTRKLDRLKENANAVDVVLTDDELKKIDLALDDMSLSKVYGSV